MTKTVKGALRAYF